VKFLCILFSPPRKLRSCATQLFHNLDLVDKARNFCHTAQFSRNFCSIARWTVVIEQ